MTFPDPADLDDLADALITHANGLTAAGAAAELICAHRSWLTSTDFVDDFITTGARPGGQPYAYIHWDDAIAALDARQLGGSSSENNILRIAASLADQHIPVHLAAVLGNLDPANIHLVTTAIARANGERHPRTGRDTPGAEAPPVRTGGALAHFRSPASRTRL